MLALACGGDAATASGTGSDVPDLALQLEARIGSLDDPDMGLSRVSQVTFGPDGRVYIAEGADRQIRVYEVDGTPVRRIGGEGEGPGEFRSLAAIGFTGDTLYAGDMTLRRFSMFTINGEFIESFQWLSSGDETPRPPMISIPTTPHIVLDDGDGLVRQMVGVMTADAGELTIPWLRIDRAMTREDTLVVQRSTIPRGRTISTGGRDISVPPPISDQPLYAEIRDGSGIAIIERPIPAGPGEHSFRLIRIDIDGDTVLVREYPYSPVETPGDELDRQIDRLTELYSSMPSAPTREALAGVLSEPGYIPAYLPPVTRLVTGLDGTIWLQRERTGADSITWDVIGGSGEMRGAIRLIENARIMAAKDDLIAVLETDEYDVPYVVLFRIARHGSETP